MVATPKRNKQACDKLLPTRFQHLSSVSYALRGLAQGPCWGCRRLVLVFSSFSAFYWLLQKRKKKIEKQWNLSPAWEQTKSLWWFAQILSITPLIHWTGQVQLSGPAWPHSNYEVPCIEEILQLARSEKSNSACQALLRLQCIRQGGTLKDIGPKSKGNTEGESQVTILYRFRERMKQLVRNYLRNGSDIRRIYRSTH